MTFDSPKDGARKIGDWVSRSTDGLIQPDPNPLPEDIRLCLDNVVYFNGRWQEPFEREQTTQRAFKAPSGICKVPMMQQSGHYSYARVAGFQAISLPYSQGRFNMLILLPEEALTDPLRPLRSVEDLLNISGRMSPRKGTVLLPRFTSHSSLNLIPSLRALGVSSAFTPGADFGGLGPNLWLGDVGHQVRIQVDEAGTVAAAWTEIQAMGAMIEPDPPFRMEVNHPFIYAIRDMVAGSYLFIGVESDPQR